MDPEDKRRQRSCDTYRPVNPDKPVDEGSTGPLTLDYASSLNFGENIISTKDEIYFASAQVLKDKNNVEKTGPLFAQITDNRGTLEGWTLSAKQILHLLLLQKVRHLKELKLSFKTLQL